MAKKSRTNMTLWPEYFDLNIPRSKGRRVSRDLAVPGIDSEELFKACKKAGLHPEMIPGKAYPSRWFDPRGCVIVMRKFSKSETIDLVAKKIVNKKH